MISVLPPPTSRMSTGDCASLGIAGDAAKNPVRFLVAGENLHFQARNLGGWLQSIRSTLMASRAALVAMTRDGDAPKSRAVLENSATASAVRAMAERCNCRVV